VQRISSKGIWILLIKLKLERQVFILNTSYFRNSQELKKGGIPLIQLKTLQEGNRKMEKMHHTHTKKSAIPSSNFLIQVANCWLSLH
jgi:hypothetical protein